MAEWSNWSGSVRCHPQCIETPRSEAELAAIVRRASSAGQGVRVCGTGHSFLPLCATDEVLISLDELRGIESVDVEKKQATVWAGTKIHALGEPLRQHGLALENQGDIDRQAIAGAVSTGTHGTGKTLGNLSSQVVGVRVATATGEIVELSAKSSPEMFPAAQLSLGALGVLSAITLQLKPAYRLHEKLRQIPIEECLAALSGEIEANRHYEFFWYSATDLAHTKTLIPTDEPPNHLPDREGERIDHSHLVFPSTREVRFNEIEYSLPAERGVDSFREVRELMRTKFSHVTWPVEYRTQRADEIYLSPAYGRATVAISVHQAAELPYQEFFAAAESIFRNHQGRPHWGKIHTRTPDELRSLYPRWDAFLAVRQQLDPGGTFLNPYLRGLFGVTS